jgi:hypothetical protein
MGLPSQARGLVTKGPSFSSPLGFRDGINKLDASGRRLVRNLVVRNVVI